MSILIPMSSAQAVSAQLRDALRDMPDLTEPDPYTPALLRGAIGDGSLGAVVALIAHVSESVRWLNLAALHSTQTSGVLRAAGWSLEERRAVAAVRNPLRAAVAHTYTASMVLDDAQRRRCGREFVR